jgi:hypothetical protein
MTKKMLAAVVVLGMLSAWGAAAAWAGDQDFVLVNKTGVVIDKLHVVPMHAKTWEEDVLGRDVLMPGEETTIRFAHDESACRWDLMVTDRDGNEVTWEDIDLCQHQRIVLRLENGEPMAYFD